jgi:urease accessory protein
MNPDSLVVLLHLCDTLFPTGAFAHSDGLETATAEGHIKTGPDLRGWMETTLGEVLRHGDAVAVARAWHAAGRRDRSVLTALDREVYALRPAAAVRESTRAMGTRLLRTWEQIRPTELTRELTAQASQFTLPVAFGVVCAASEISVRAAVEGFIYTRMAATVSAAMRLMPLGQHDGHRLLSDMLAQAPGVATKALSDEGPLTSFVPMMDIMTISHQYVESRLFRS